MWRDGMPDEFDESDKLHEEEGRGLPGADDWLREQEGDYDWFDDPDPEDDDEGGDDE